MYYIMILTKKIIFKIEKIFTSKSSNSTPISELWL